MREGSESPVACHLFRVTCHMSCVSCHVSHVPYDMYFFLFFSDNSVELVHGEYVINRAYPSSLDETDYFDGVGRTKLTNDWRETKD